MKKAKIKHANSEQSNDPAISNLDETIEWPANEKSVSQNDMDIKSNNNIIADDVKLNGKKKNRSKKRKRFEIDTNTKNSEEYQDGSCIIESRADENACSKISSVEPQIDVENNINDRAEENETNENSLTDHNEIKQTKKHPKKPKIKKKMLYNLPRPTKESANTTSANNNKAEKAMNYLHAWNSDRNTWKFEKLTQFWLIKNMFNENLVSNDDFKILLEYMKDMKGQIRNTASDLCLKMIHKMDKIENKDENENLVYSRAQSALLYVQ